MDLPTDIALSVMQPWAWLIVNDLKDIENRDWWTKRRGATLIHAGKKIDKDAYADLLDGRHPVTGERFPYPVPATLETGGIVGAVDIVDCVREHPSAWFVGRFGFVLRNGRPLPFQPVRGELGFFRPKWDAPVSVPKLDVGYGQLL